MQNDLSRPQVPATAAALKRSKAKSMQNALHYIYIYIISWNKSSYYLLIYFHPGVEKIWYDSIFRDSVSFWGYFNSMSIYSRTVVYSYQSIQSARQKPKQLTMLLCGFCTCLLVAGPSTHHLNLFDSRLPPFSALDKAKVQW